MKKNIYPGKLIVVEGLDGSGKTAQLNLTKNWLEIEGYAVCLFKRKNSQLLSSRIQEAKQAKELVPTTYSLIHASDFSSLTYTQIIPALKAGMIILFNKYIYTSLAKDYLRGQNKKWVQKIYDFAIEPDLSFYFKVDIEDALARMTPEQKENDFYDSGMDIGFSKNHIVSIKKYQNQLNEQYEIMSKIYNFVTVDCNKPMDFQQKVIKESIKEVILK
jgi:dTMP kinase